VVRIQHHLLPDSTLLIDAEVEAHLLPTNRVRQQRRGGGGG